MKLFLILIKPWHNNLEENASKSFSLIKKKTTKNSQASQNFCIVTEKEATQRKWLSIFFCLVLYFASRLWDMGILKSTSKQLGKLVYFNGDPIGKFG